MKNWVWYGVAIILIACDQGSKWLALHHLAPYQPMTVFPGLNWTLMYNSGSAFGLFNQTTVWLLPYLFIGFGLSMSVILIIWMARCATEKKLELLALSCILSGAVGNVVDRIRFRYVIDFIQVFFDNHYFPVFNIADSAICVGAVLLLFASREKNRKV